MWKHSSACKTGFELQVYSLWSYQNFISNFNLLISPNNNFNLWTLPNNKKISLAGLSQFHMEGIGNLIELHDEDQWHAKKVAISETFCYSLLVY
jgi:hypothetical protein